MVERSQPAQPPEGEANGTDEVGLARKIGADIALALIDRDFVTSPWIFNTDADVKLPLDYFGPLDAPGNQENSAFIYPFSHSIENPGSALEENALLLYEISLLYYGAGLNYASSPYAFPSIGSTVAVNA